MPLYSHSDTSFFGTVDGAKCCSLGPSSSYPEDVAAILFLLLVPYDTPSCPGIKLLAWVRPSWATRSIAQDSARCGEDVRRKLAELVADHVFGDGDAVVDLAVVHVEAQADEARQDGRGASLRAYGGRRVARLLGPYDG
jgi:hypothetical protein